MGADPDTPRPPTVRFPVLLTSLLMRAYMPMCVPMRICDRGHWEISEILSKHQVRVLDFHINLLDRLDGRSQSALLSTYPFSQAIRRIRVNNMPSVRANKVRTGMRRAFANTGLELIFICTLKSISHQVRP